MSYAKGTTVAASRTTAEIQAILSKRGVTKFAYMADGDIATIAFEYKGMPFRLTLKLPSSKEFTHHANGKRTETAAHTAWQSEHNRKWRAFLMIIKAKVVAVEEGITTMEHEFYPALLLNTGKTVGETHPLNAVALEGRVSSLSLGGRSE